MGINLFLLFSISCVVEAISTPSLYNRFRSAPPRSHEPFDLAALSDSLHRSFPTATHNHPAYASALHLIDSLGTAPSCQRTAAAAFVSDCSHFTRSSSGGTDNFKVLFAVKLAVCEFKATGVTFPSECSHYRERGDGEKQLSDTAGKRQLQQCLRKLEERPQWWTTLSNNLQNAVVICAAVRHEVEEDNLLNLYRNVTKTQRILADALNVAVQNSRDDLEAQRSRFVDLKNSIQMMNDEMVDAGKYASGVLGKHAEMIEDLLDTIRRKIQLNWETEMAGLDEIAKATKYIYQNTHQLTTDITEANSHLKNALKHTGVDVKEEFLSLLLLVKQAGEDIIDELRERHKASSKDSAALASSMTEVGQKLQELEPGVTRISIALAQVFNALETLLPQVNQQSETLTDLQTKMTSTAVALEHTFGRLLLSASNLEKTLDETEARVQSLGFQNHLWLSFGAFAIGICLLLGSERGKLIVGAASVTGGLMMLLCTPEVTQVAQHVIHVLFLQNSRTGDFSLRNAEKISNYSPDHKHFGSGPVMFDWLAAFGYSSMMLLLCGFAIFLAFLSLPKRSIASTPHKLPVQKTHQEPENV